MKPMILLCAGVVACLPAGCHSRSHSERTAPQQSTNPVVDPAPATPPSPGSAGPAQDVTPASSTADNSSARKVEPKAAADNPRVAKFVELDTDHDGQLSMAEFGVGRTSKDAAKWFGRRDADRNGFLNLAEFVPQSASSESGRQTEVKRSDTVRPPSKSPDQ